MRKATILIVGDIERNAPINWSFDCGMEIPAMEITVNGELLIAGYTLEELKEISERYKQIGEI